MAGVDERVARRIGPALARAVVGLALLSACAADPPEPVRDTGAGADHPPYCAATGSRDETFWELVDTSCRVVGDGDLAQAEALRQALDEVPDDGVAEFHRTFVRLNLDLAAVGSVADELCAPGLGLGDDLGADYRSWIIAHGQAAYEAVVADPEALRSFPDAQAGCGLGEPFGYAAYHLYLERTGLSARRADLPGFEIASP